MVFLLLVVAAFVGSSASNAGVPRITTTGVGTAAVVSNAVPRATAPVVIATTVASTSVPRAAVSVAPTPTPTSTSAARVVVPVVTSTTVVPRSAPPLDVAFLGDSNVVRATGTIVSMLGGNASESHVTGRYVPSFFARAGIRLAPAFWAAKLAGPRFHPDVAVLNIGINDTVSPVRFADYRSKIDAFMGLIPRNVPVLFPSYPYAIEQSARRAGAIAVNHAWVMSKARWPNLVILPWAALANGHPEWINKSDPDRHQWVHYTPAGYAALTALELATLDKLRA